MLDQWLDPAAQDEELTELIMELFMEQTARERVLLLGRQTFTDFRGSWPHLEDDPTGIAEALNRVDKHVVTSGGVASPAWRGRAESAQPTPSRASN